MLTPYLPYPPVSGGQIRTLNLLKYLSKNHHATLVSLYKSNSEKKYSTHLSSYCSKVYVCKRAEKPWQFNILAKAIFTPKPLLIVRNFSQEALLLLNKLLSEEHFDVIHVETFYVMPHLMQTKIPVLLVDQTIEYQVYQHFVNKLPFFLRPFFAIDVFKLKYWETFYWEKATQVATVSELDQEVIKKTAPFLNPVIVPNGSGDEMFIKDMKPKKIGKPVFLFQGNFFWLQNQEAALFLLKNIFPLLIKAIPNAKIIIAGQETRKVKQINSKQVEFIEIHPDKSEMVKEIYQSATLFIAPIYGPGGTRLKILAAMASGLPVISTKTGIQGLEVEDSKHVLIANEPETFVAKAVEILGDEKLYNQIRKNAYELAKEKYSWNSITKKLEVVYENIIKKNENRN